MSAPTVILMTGAPPPSALDDPSSWTVSRFDEPFHALVPALADDALADGPAPPSQPTHAAWRSVPLSRGLDGRHDDAGAELFFTTADVTRDEESAEDVWTQFCEHSLARRGGEASTPSQHRRDNADADHDDDDDTTSGLVDATLSPSPGAAPVPLHLSDLDDVPSAARLLALQPQSVTLNLIVGVVSVAAPRPVTTRWGRTLALVEVVVADDTAAGFAVTFWLDAAAAGTACVARLRRQDVVLLENVALHVFRAKVHGQSLRRGLTRVSLLWRRDGSGHYSTRRLDADVPARHPQRHKARLVKDWVLRFVGRDPAADAPSTRPLRSWDRPPDDTQ